MFNKNKCKNKKWFCKSCLQWFSSEIVLNSHKEDCLLINGGRSVQLEKRFIEFNNFNKMIPAPFKIYADFECLFKEVDTGIHNDCFSYTYIKTTFLVVLLINSFVLMISIVNMLYCTRERMQFINFFSLFLMSMIIV